MRGRPVDRNLGLPTLPIPEHGHALAWFEVVGHIRGLSRLQVEHPWPKASHTQIFSIRPASWTGKKKKTNSSICATQCRWMNPLWLLCSDSQCHWLSKYSNSSYIWCCNLFGQQFSTQLFHFCKWWRSGRRWLTGKPTEQTSFCLSGAGYNLNSEWPAKDCCLVPPSRMWYQQPLQTYGTCHKRSCTGVRRGVEELGQHRKKLNTRRRGKGYDVLRNRLLLKKSNFLKFKKHFVYK